jgi:hypothetical protein
MFFERVVSLWLGETTVLHSFDTINFCRKKEKKKGPISQWQEILETPTRTFLNSAIFSFGGGCG